MAADNTFTKDPNAVLDYKWDWRCKTNGSKPSGTDWLAIGETIQSLTVTADTGITVDSSSRTDTNTSVTAWLSGGTAGTTYSVICHIVTSGGRQDDRTIYISVEQR